MSSSSSNRIVANAMNANANVSRTKMDTASNVTNETSRSSSAGRTGRLTRNMNIRSAGNRTAEIIGTHYQGARIRVLDETSYSTNEGWSTWFKVEVLEDGTDSEGRYGYGNNWERGDNFGWMEAQRVGWMNSRYITLD